MIGDAHTEWLARAGDELIDFGRGATLPAGGFGWLDSRGRVDPTKPLHTYLNARMTHVFALAAIRGRPGTLELAAHGVAALSRLLHDDVHGGWFAVVAPDGTPVDPRKTAYQHAFVVLAAASAAAAEVEGARGLLADALDVVDDRFWDAGVGRCVDGYDRTLTVVEDYRGANANMHMVEAFLAAGDVLTDSALYQRALRIAEFLVHEVAAGHKGRLPEHFSPSWEPLLDYNAERPDDPFRPYGWTPGHSLEWARLLLAVETALGTGAPTWLVPAARQLVDVAVDHGWAPGGAPGFVYTVDWHDRPVVRTRMHWVAAEAVAAAAVLSRRTGEERYARWYRAWWDQIQRCFIDPVHGSWHHELDPSGAPSATVWSGKPDIYHAYQATAIPMLPVSASVVGGVLSEAAARR